MKIIDVTQQDIDEGSTRNPYGCAVARAMKRVGIDATVFPTEIQVNGKRLLTTPEISNFIVQFDKEKELVKPFSFDLDMLSPFYPTQHSLHMEYAPVYIKENWVEKEMSFKIFPMAEMKEDKFWSKQVSPSKVDWVGSYGII